MLSQLAYFVLWTISLSLNISAVKSGQTTSVDYDPLYPLQSQFTAIQPLSAPTYRRDSNSTVISSRLCDTGSSGTGCECLTNPVSSCCTSATKTETVTDDLTIIPLKSSGQFTYALPASTADPSSHGIEIITVWRVDILSAPLTTKISNLQTFIFFTASNADATGSPETTSVLALTESTSTSDVSTNTTTTSTSTLTTNSDIGLFLPPKSTSVLSSTTTSLSALCFNTDFETPLPCSTSATNTNPPGAQTVTSAANLPMIPPIFHALTWQSILTVLILICVGFIMEDYATKWLDRKAEKPTEKSPDSHVKLCTCRARQLTGAPTEVEEGEMLGCVDWEGEGNLVVGDSGTAPASVIKKVPVVEEGGKTAPVDVEVEINQARGSFSCLVQ